MEGSSDSPCRCSVFTLSRSEDRSHSTVAGFFLPKIPFEVRANSQPRRLTIPTLVFNLVVATLYIALVPLLFTPASLALLRVSPFWNGMQGLALMMMTMLKPPASRTSDPDMSARTPQPFSPPIRDREGCELDRLTLLMAAENCD